MKSLKASSPIIVTGKLSIWLGIITDADKPIYFSIFILALQQFDGNIIGPKILGESTGISSFWVIFSITLFGGLWGVPGMIVGVPLFAVFYAILKTIITTKLSQKALPATTDDYINVDYINEENKEFIELKTEDVKNIELKQKKERSKKNKSKTKN